MTHSRTCTIEVFRGNALSSKDFLFFLLKKYVNDVLTRSPRFTRRLPGVSDFQVGDKVCADLGLVETCIDPKPAQGNAGAFAEFAVVPASLCARARGLDPAAAAGLPLAGLTAYQALFTKAARTFTGEPLGDLKANQKLLVLGGATSVGAFAIQLAKNAGAHVACTASAKTNSRGVAKTAACAELGADVVFEEALETLFSERAYAAKRESVGACFKTAHCLVFGEDDALSAPIVSKESDGKETSKDVDADETCGALRFAFELPDAGSSSPSAAAYRARLGELVSLIPRLVDVVARVRLSDAQKERAAKARKRVADEDFKKKLKTSAAETAGARLDKKLEKMSDKEKARWREKQAKKQTRKAGGRSMIRKG